jgi:hypothetical protein
MQIIRRPYLWPLTRLELLLIAHLRPERVPKYETRVSKNSNSIPHDCRIQLLFSVPVYSFLPLINTTRTSLPSQTPPFKSIPHSQTKSLQSKIFNTKPSINSSFTNKTTFNAKLSIQSLQYPTFQPRLLHKTKTSFKNSANHLLRCERHARHKRNQVTNNQVTVSLDNSEFSSSHTQTSINRATS